MKKTSKFTYIIFLISVVLLSACGQAVVSTSLTLAPQVTAPSQASRPTTPTTNVPQDTSSPQASSTPTPTTIIPQAATRTPTQQISVSGNAYIAYASGLASNFTKGDICSLEQPFMLEGDSLPVSSDLIANFTPTSSTHGDYTFTNNIMDGACVDSSTGTYDVTFYTASEGEIIMTGMATRVCQGVTTFSGTTEFRIAIRKAQPISCP